VTFCDRQKCHTLSVTGTKPVSDDNDSVWNPDWNGSCKVFVPELEAAVHRKCTLGAGIHQLKGIGPKHFMLSVNDNTEFSS